jgi:signal transduction histidine kinase
VIGVLEVLNKRDGGFSSDDVALLTTFAGQAAVAIENARLFQLTDQQLSQRVSELETLERIDFELNRSLDLEKVARIAVEWAMENSSATAAALGVIETDPDTDEPLHLRIAYQQGYTADNIAQPEMLQQWEIGRGIVARVLRSRQPELVPDVTIDPDPMPILRGALSRVAIPMLSGGDVIALLVLETDREPHLRLADMPFLQRLAEHAAIAIANAQLYAELTAANQSKSEFVSFVAHELKNPLTSIRGFSDFLLKGVMGPLNEQQRNFVGTIRSSAERMNTMVSDLNDATKLQTNNLRIEFSAVSLHTVVEETLRPLAKQIEDKRQVVQRDIPADLPALAADQNRLIQVMTNLMSNAHKYSPPETTITVSARLLGTTTDPRGRAAARPCAGLGARSGHRHERRRPAPVVHAVFPQRQPENARAARHRPGHDHHARHRAAARRRCVGGKRHRRGQHLPLHHSHRLHAGTRSGRLAHV